MVERSRPGTVNPAAGEADRFTRALARFDELHREDPARERSAGEEVPAELAYARRMSTWLVRLAPDASEALRLAARCQHLRRFTIPRATFPAGRQGYLDWRNECKRQHAALAAGVLREVGYDEPTIARVEDLVQKRRLKADPEAQQLEDVAGVVFLESYLADFARKHNEEKLVDILRKTWRKLSPRGQQAAAALPIAPHLRGLVERAVAGAAPGGRGSGGG